MVFTLFCSIWPFAASVNPASGFFFAAHWLISKTDADQTQQPARMNVNDFIRVERLYLVG